MMIISKKKQLIILKHLFKEGCLVASSDTTKPKHDLIDGVSNLEVLCLMKSLTSRGYVRRQYCWRHNYWYLNEEGIEYLREFLHLPNDVVPITHKVENTAVARGDVRMGGEFRGGKDNGPNRGFQPRFRGGDRNF